MRAVRATRAGWPLLALLALASNNSTGSACGPNTTLMTAAGSDEPAVTIEFPRELAQGCPAFGRVPPGSSAMLDERALRVGPRGELVFGVGRDQTAPASLVVTAPGKAPARVTIPVVPREWPIERVDGVPPATVDPPPAIAARIAREQASVAAARARDDPRTDFATIFDWPLRGRISGVYGSQRIYNGSPRSPHSGLDVAAPAGTVLRAPAAGVITFAEPDLYLTGGTVLIDHGHGLSSVFLHLSRIDVEPGQRIDRGEVFGAVGATGRATGPHMHWGLNWFDVRLDPAQLPGIAGAGAD